MNFQWIGWREKDSTPATTGSYNIFSTTKHGNYAGGFSGWLGTNPHVAGKGTPADRPDTIYSGDPGPHAGAAPPFTVGTMSYPIVWQWRVGTKSEHSFGSVNQEHEIFSAGKCESRKGGHTESAQHSDATSGYT